MSTGHKPHSEPRESLAVAIEDVLLLDSPEGDSPRNIAANLREVLRGLDGLVEQLETYEQALRAYRAIFAAWEGRDSITLNEEALRQWKSIADSVISR